MSLKDAVYHKTRLNRCPSCNSKLDALTGDEAGPVADDFSICCYCGKFLQFNSDMTIRLASEAALAKADPSDVSIAVKSVEAFQSARHKSGRPLPTYPW